jgi:nucleoside-diphosphate-sugar epimerase
MGKVLVTGAAGFVGRHLTRRLLEEGHEVHAVDSLCPLTGGIDPDLGWPFFRPYDYQSFIFYREDCREWFARVADSDFDYAFHLAAMVGGRLMIENHPLAVADDLSIDATFWQWATRVRPGKCVCFSSSAAYPIALQKYGEYTLLKESMIRFDGKFGMPDMSYGWAKLTSEYLARLATQKYGLKTVCFRPFSGYGEDQDSAYPFPSICQRALENRGKDRLGVWGSGTQMRDFIHIDDCVEGVLKMMGSIDDGDAVNLSTGIYTSFIDLATIAAEITGYYPHVHGISDKPEGVFARGGDITKQSSLGFVAATPLRKGIERALEYFDGRPAKP